MTTERYPTRAAVLAAPVCKLRDWLKSLPPASTFDEELILDLISLELEQRDLLIRHGHIEGGLCVAH